MSGPLVFERAPGSPAGPRWVVPMGRHVPVSRAAVADRRVIEALQAIVILDLEEEISSSGSERLSAVTVSLVEPGADVFFSPASLGGGDMVAEALVIRLRTPFLFSEVVLFPRVRRLEAWWARARRWASGRRRAWRFAWDRWVEDLDVDAIDPRPI